jgi:hypothetical protein
MWGQCQSQHIMHTAREHPPGERSLPPRAWQNAARPVTRARHVNCRQRLMQSHVLCIRYAMGRLAGDGICTWHEAFEALFTNDVCIVGKTKQKLHGQVAQNTAR